MHWCVLHVTINSKSAELVVPKWKYRFISYERLSVPIFKLADKERHKNTSNQATFVAIYIITAAVFCNRSGIFLPRGE
jgi:hypothetical protein